MSKLGIGIVTFNRRSRLEKCVSMLREHTKSDHVIVVADDGSSDGTVDFCKDQNLIVVCGKNSGVCWNKNRALYALANLNCDPILLLEDDCYPIEDGWDYQWRVATGLFGHVSYAHPKLSEWQISGTGTASDPIVNNKATAQCSSISASLLSEVGYFDTRFKGYGVGHAEWTTRIKRAGKGFKNIDLDSGVRAKANLYIYGGLIADDAPTFKDKDSVRKNEELFAKIKRDPIYRHPWHTEEERSIFLAEMVNSGVGEAMLQK